LILLIFLCDDGIFCLFERGDGLADFGFGLLIGVGGFELEIGLIMLHDVFPTFLITCIAHSKLLFNIT
jgi:hypothetical protein